MNKNELPDGHFRIIIADVNEKSILLNEEVVCICGAFTKLKDASAGLCSTHGMVLSKFMTDVAIATATGAEDAARRMKKGAKSVERRKIWKLIKEFFKKRRIGDGKD